MTAGSAPEVVRRYFEVVNAADWAAMPALWTPDGELRAVGAPVRRGPDEIAAHFPWTLSALPVHHDEPTRVVVAGAVVLVEIRFAGRTRSDRVVEFDALDVFELADDRIARLSSWYDTAAVAAQVHGR